MKKKGGGPCRGVEGTSDPALEGCQGHRRRRGGGALLGWSVLRTQAIHRRSAPSKTANPTDGGRKKVPGGGKEGLVGISRQKV